tara:strand:+ start:2411 stop:2770 length:360 start_codon:yes stop_codon:yes gene_type:complete
MKIIIIAWDQNTDKAVIPERVPNVGEWSYNKDTKTKKQYNPQIETLISVKNTASSSVNPEAEKRITSLDWKKERAEEQPSKYSLTDVLAERQAIRDASNKAKLDIEALTTIEEVKAFTW